MLLFAGLPSLLLFGLKIGEESPSRSQIQPGIDLVGKDIPVQVILLGHGLHMRPDGPRVRAQDLDVLGLAPLTHRVFSRALAL